VIIKSLEELRQADDRTLHFTPLGLALDRQMTPDSAAQYQQERVARLELVPTVAESTRMSFDNLRAVFGYGILCYEIFTLVNDHALLVVEQALRDRFIAYHGGTVTFIDKQRSEHVIAAERYEQVFDFANAHPKYGLQINNGRSIPFNAMLSGLNQWAREVGLLRGERNRGIEKAISKLRNYVAHSAGFHLTDPVQAWLTLSDLAEIINQLWGMPTPGGRLYPGP
jgi:hypothetical protein